MYMCVCVCEIQANECHNFKSFIFIYLSNKILLLQLILYKNYKLNIKTVKFSTVLIYRRITN